MEEKEPSSQSALSGQHLDLVLQGAASVGLWQWDFHTGSIHWSRQQEKLCDLEEGEFDGTIESWEKLIYPDDLAAFQSIRQSSSSHQDHQAAYRILKKNKEVAWMLSRTRNQFETSGRSTGMLGVTMEIAPPQPHGISADRRSIVVTGPDDILHQRIRDLETTVEHLTRSNRDLESFAHIASHDLQEPLRKIETFAHMLAARSENFSAKEHDYIQKILSATERMGTLVKDILRFSRIEMDEGVFELTDLNTAVLKALDDLEVEIALKKAIIKYEDLPTLEAIPSQMHQLFLNLLGNGLKFAKKGEAPLIHIDVTTLSEKEKENLHLDHDRAYVIIVVADNGIGFDPKHSEKIFELFHREDTTLRNGTGIGLAVCKKITDRHHGKIHALSTPDEGSEFFIILPLTQEKNTVAPLFRREPTA